MRQPSVDLPKLNKPIIETDMPKAAEERPPLVEELVEPPIEPLGMVLKAFQENGLMPMHSRVSEDNILLKDPVLDLIVDRLAYINTMISQYERQLRASGKWGK